MRSQFQREQPDLTEESNVSSHSSFLSISQSQTSESSLQSHSRTTSSLDQTDSIEYNGAQTAEQVLKTPIFPKLILQQKVDSPGPNADPNIGAEPMTPNTQQPIERVGLSLVAKNLRDSRNRAQTHNMKKMQEEKRSSPVSVANIYKKRFSADFTALQLQKMSDHSSDFSIPEDQKRLSLWSSVLMRNSHSKKSDSKKKKMTNDEKTCFAKLLKKLKKIFRAIKKMEWAEMSMLIHISVYLLFIFSIFLVMQISFLYKAQYQFMSTLENRLGRRINSTVDQQYETVAGSTAIRMEMFMNVTEQLIAGQSILLSQILQNDTLADPLDDLGPHPILGAEDCSKFISELAHPSYDELTSEQFAYIRGVCSIRDFLTRSIEFHFFTYRNVSSQIEPLALESFIVYIDGTVDGNSSTKGQPLILKHNKNLTTPTSPMSIRRKQHLASAFEAIKEIRAAIVDLETLNSTPDNALTFAYPIFKNPRDRSSKVLGMVLWQFDFEEAIDAMVIPQSFYSQQFSHMDIRMPYLEPLENPIRKICGKMMPNQSEKVGFKLYDHCQSWRPDVIATAKESEEYENLVLEAQYRLVREKEHIHMGQLVRLENGTFDKTVEEEDNFILSRLANLVFEDWFDDQFDVDFVEPIKDIGWKVREITFYDQKVVNLYVSTTQSGYDPVLTPLILEDEQAWLQDLAIADFSEDPLDDSTDEYSTRNCREILKITMQPLEPSSFLSNGEDDLIDMTGSTSNLASPAGSPPSFPSGDPETPPPPRASFLPDSDFDSDSYSTFDPSAATIALKHDRTERQFVEISKINCVYMLIGESLRKKTPYQLYLRRYLDTYITTFYYSIFGLVVVVSIVLFIIVRNLIYVILILPISELTAFINTKSEKETKAKEERHQTFNRRQSTRTILENIGLFGKSYQSLFREQSRRRQIKRSSSFSRKRDLKIGEGPFINSLSSSYFDEEDDVHIDEIHRLRFYFARFFLQSWQLHDSKLYYEPLIGSFVIHHNNQAEKKELRVAYMNKSVDRNYLNPRFLFELVQMPSVAERLFDREKVYDSISCRVLEVAQLKVRQRIYFLQEVIRVSNSFYKDSDMSLRNRNSSLKAVIDQLKDEDYLFNSTIEMKQASFKGYRVYEGLHEIVEDQDQEIEPPVFRTSQYQRWWGESLEITKLADQTHRLAIKTTLPPENPETKKTTSFRIKSPNEYAFHGDSFCVKKVTERRTGEHSEEVRNFLVQQDNGLPLSDSAAALVSIEDSDRIQKIPTAVQKYHMLTQDPGCSDEESLLSFEDIPDDTDRHCPAENVNMLVEWKFHLRPQTNRSRKGVA